MEQELFLLALAAVGALAGFINVMAGGGSLLTLGLMIMMGVDPSVANGTNRIGVLAGTASGAAAYKAAKLSEMKQSMIYGLLALPGAVIGAYYSVKISDALFQKLLVGVMFFVLITMFLPKKKNATGFEGILGKILSYTAMFAVGLYGGFIQVGVGFLIMASLRYLKGEDLVIINMHKTFTVLIYTLPILLVFGMTGNINWLYAIALSIGNLAGSWISVKVSLKKGEKVVKYMLALSIVLMAIKFILTF